MLKYVVNQHLKYIKIKSSVRISFKILIFIFIKIKQLWIFYSYNQISLSNHQRVILDILSRLHKRIWINLYFENPLSFSFIPIKSVEVFQVISGFICSHWFTVIVKFRPFIKELKILQLLEILRGAKSWLIGL